jgi:hypothetical protein
MKMSALILAAFVTLTGCGGRPTPAPPAPPPPAAPSGVLDTMDTRVPVPLLPMMANHQKENMRDHLLAVQEIVAGLAKKDFDGISRAAARIGYSEQMGQMCNHMGAGAPGFTEQALRFHHTADKIADAARSRDMPGVVGALGDTLATCTGCHATFKQKIVDEATFASLANQPVPSHQPQMPMGP